MTAEMSGEMGGARKRTSVAAVAAALVLALALAWLSTRETTRATDVAAPKAATADVACIEAPATQPSGLAPAAPAIEVAVAEPEPPPVDLRGVRVTLVVTDASPVRVRPLEVRVLVERGAFEEPVNPGSNYRGTIDDSNLCRIDLTRLFFDEASWPGVVLVETVDADFPSSRFDVPLTADGVPLTPERLAQQREVELDVTIMLANVALVRGSLLSTLETRNPLRAALVEPRPIGEFPSDAASAKVELRRGGRFELACAAGREYLLVAFADGLRPVSRHLGVIEVGAHDLGSIVLDEGAVIRGRIEIEGEFSVTATSPPTAIENRLWSADPDLTCMGDDVVWKRAHAFAARDGTFELSGLVPGPYDLTLRPRGGVTAVFVETEPVEAPADGVVLGAGVVAVRLELRRNGRPAPDERVEWGMVGMDGIASAHRVTSDAAGRVTLWLTPGLEIDLEVRGRTHRIVAGATSDTGWRVIDL
jgi:hypothetical protein